jgi:hypothetical protein
MTASRYPSFVAGEPWTSQGGLLENYSTGVLLLNCADKVLCSVLFSSISTFQIEQIKPRVS